MTKKPFNSIVLFACILLIGGIIWTRSRAHTSASIPTTAQTSATTSPITIIKRTVYLYPESDEGLTAEYAQQDGRSIVTLYRYTGAVLARLTQATSSSALSRVYADSHYRWTDQGERGILSTATSTVTLTAFR